MAETSKTMFQGTAEQLCDALKPFVEQRPNWIVYKAPGLQFPSFLHELDWTFGVGYFCIYSSESGIF